MGGFGLFEFDASKRGRLCGRKQHYNPLILMKKIAYIRVSTPEQRHDRQVEGLREFADELEIETLSATAKRRPVFDRVIASLKAGDMLVVWDLDRAFRSVVDALTEAEKLRARGVHFRIASLSIDTTTPAGIFVYTIMSALAEFEQRNLSQRTREGMQAARLRGARIGRPPVLSKRQLRQAARRRKKGETFEEIAGDYRVDGWTLSRALKRTGYQPGA
ncbi:MAG: recombinase family protein [Rhizobiaceae bacterium]